MLTRPGRHRAALTDTATVRMVRRDGGVAGRVTLVKLEGGWAVTTVERCQH